jgi:hypothetical protein
MTQAFNLAQHANKINSAGQLDASTGLVNAVPVANGGTGAATLTANNLLVGNGAGAVNFIAPGTSGNSLLSNGSAWVSSAAPYSGGRGQVFTSSGTFTIPAGVSAVKATVIGGGGGAGGINAAFACGCATVSCVSGGGGGGGSAVKFLTGLTSGNTLTITVGAAGTAGSTGGAGGAGGTSSVASGTQTITSISATGGGGGAGGVAHGSSTTGAGGAGSGGDMNFSGQRSQTGGSNVIFNNDSINNPSVPQPVPTAYGCGAGGFSQTAARVGVAGSQGVVLLEW